MLAKNSEITAMRAAGISIFSITRPIVYFAVLCTLFNITFNETIMPRANSVRERMYRTLIKRQDAVSSLSRQDFYYIGDKNIIFHFKGSYDALRKRGSDVEIDFYRNGTLWKRIACSELGWTAAGWVARAGSERTFFADSLSTAYFTELKTFPVPIDEKPEDILKEPKLPEEMNFLELNEYIGSLQRTGEDPMKIGGLRADLHFNVSLPFITIIVVMFGVSLTVRVGKSGVAKVFGIGLLAGFVYYFFVNLGLGFGRSGAMHPVLGAWLGNMVFFPLSTAYFFKVSKLE
jgi:lipopolysaccharide export system permease protein